MKHTHTVNDALRMMGQLLLRAPTSGVCARDKLGNPTSLAGPEACQFCFTGAAALVGGKLGVDVTKLRNRAYELTEINGPRDWDHAGSFRRSCVALTLSKVSDP